jgi:hypothetical protein
MSPEHLTRCVGCRRQSRMAEGLWHRALTLATDAAQVTSTEDEAQQSRLKRQLDLRAHTLSQREVELDELLRSRERTVKELEDHLRTSLSMLTKRDMTIAALESRLVVAQQEIDGCRARLAKLVQRAITRHRSATTKQGAKSSNVARAHKQGTRKKPKRNPPGKRR